MQSAGIDYSRNSYGYLYASCWVISCGDGQPKREVTGAWLLLCSPNAFTSAPAAANFESTINMYGSVIQSDKKVIGEIIPIVAAPFSLTYFSDRTQGRIGNYKFKSIITGAEIADHCMASLKLVTLNFKIKHLTLPSFLKDPYRLVDFVFLATAF